MSAHLVERAQQGDQEAFEQLVHGLYDPMFAAATRILRDPYLAEDAVQDAIVRAWRDLRALRDRGRFEAWIHRLLVSACLDLSRKRRRRPVEVPILDLDRGADDDPTRGLDRRDELERAFEHLSPEHRAALVLTHYLGYSAPEAAAILGVPTGTVHSRVHHATRVMRSVLMAGATTAPLTPRGN